MTRAVARVGDLVTIYITNNITNYQVGVHCKDKNHDIGLQNINVGESYIFTLVPTFLIPRTLYFCSFSWPKGFHYFDIYVQSRDQEDCRPEKQCHWIIKESGPCKIKSGSVDCFNWNTNVVLGGKQLGHNLNM
ncbi:putative plant self-incompatibility S1 [Medicago truncatula]|uniref:S-protein homolog n=1 Tax=Medicago truncatula TaxID=3880 RepID=G7IBM8_MEDTR|nr:plant self-incompatibility protein S1 family protein [Medicago truncatula]RHN79889.1 putative plant self-incompatibility S1 [Medicago truncatula]